MDVKQKFEDMKTDLSIRLYGLKWNLERKTKATLDWCSNNKELTIAFLTAAGIAVREGVKMANSVSRRIDAKQEERHKELEIYDHSIGKWQELRRPMKLNETIEFDRRKQNGESTVQILNDMGLLRR